ncbi:electron transport complex protein RnfC [Azotobacter vinelandii CA]|uniref:Ion-translocating oxidoreductase complex subunit C n=2 Tax=Azotobacter vinelandii TaxID=354 RepID=C1DEF1_AZOVD|nr:electron transport complex subunit RsxC [Azotobacter vinelandii]ACO78136.1 Electron transport complex, subunit C [Azotobacter vinelandii DJ]AGK13039.1 electron transport complex protein RnfC [Azotobacter vinelandii CA]AGK18687.1 electron transport complex protein RnfC [Azotobacter vinelandii CA6]SFX54546.1 electron transport complex protein RnfC [Azotobacter vinelandii]GLK59975.1 electron transport complex subunit C [Azotobacter vinelandii]
MSEAKLWEFQGGIHPPERKELSNRTPIQRVPLPARLILPLGQHIGTPAEPIVTVGERVLKGQPIATASGRVSAPLHAPTSGTVSFIGMQPYPHVSGLLAPAIVIDSDGLDEWTALEPCADHRSLEPAILLERIRQAGISGLGGAGFPTAVKLTARPQRKIHTLIVNGAECEPYITADDRLMRERAAELIIGIDILVQLIEPEQVLIGIEDNKPEAVAAVRAALGERSFGLRVLPTKYPSGGERQLIEILTGRQVPSGGLPADIGMLCQNVGTCVAIHDTVLLGRPLISRIVTLTGEALARPMNVEALLGTPVGELLAFAGLDEARMDRLIMGGPMMGFTLSSLDVPLIKTANCLLAPTRSELPPPPPALPCIRCGACADVCPASLLPQQLHFFALGREHEQLRAYNLFDCIECGACAYVCPSSLPLVQYYRVAKAEIRELEQKRHKAGHSRLRFELRQERLRKSEEQKEAERRARVEKAARARAVQAESSSVPHQETSLASRPTGLSEHQKKLKIEASMTQVALKKAEKQLAVHPTAELEAQVAELRAAAEAARKALEATTPAAPSAGNDTALKKAKIELAMRRTELKKAEKASVDDSELAHLREALADAKRALHAAEEASDRPAPQLVRIDKRPVDEKLRALKTELAFARADLRKLERDETIDPPVLESARTRLAEAERRLAGYQSE